MPLMAFAKLKVYPSRVIAIPNIDMVAEDAYMARIDGAMLNMHL